MSTVLVKDKAEHVALFVCLNLVIHVMSLCFVKLCSSVLFFLFVLFPVSLTAFITVNP